MLNYSAFLVESQHTFVAVESAPQQVQVESPQQDLVESAVAATVSLTAGSSVEFWLLELPQAANINVAAAKTNNFFIILTIYKV